MSKERMAIEEELQTAWNFPRRSPELLLKNRTVLIVEDEVSLNLSLAMRLSDAGVQVISVYDGLRALERGINEEPDLILLDLGLPRMHGMKVLHRLRMHPFAQKAPVMILTGNLDPKLPEKARNWGVKWVFRKPFSSREVVQTALDVLNGVEEG